MLLELSEDQAFFRATTRRFIEERTPLTTTRSLYEVPEGFDRQWWREAAAVGWTSLFVPEVHGGIGSRTGAADAALVAGEMGRLVAPGPFGPVSVVAAALTWDGTEDQRADVLPGIASGERIATWAFAEAGDRWSVASFETSAEIGRDDIVTLRGEKSYVEAAAVSDTFLVTAMGRGGPTQVLVPATAVGVTVVPGRSVDMTRRFGRVRLNDVRLPLDAIVGTQAGADAVVERQLALALAIQCAELIGVAERTLEFTLEYGRERIAFGRPIVSFQALKHRIADMAGWLEGMKAVTEALVSAIDGEADTTLLASVAKVYVGQHALDIVDDCVQITGGLGVTWEHDIHLYNRRAVASRAMFGSPEQHRLRVFEQLDVGAAS